MRLLQIGNMFPPHHLGGAELIWHSAVQQARSAGHRVRILTSTHREEALDPTIAEDPEIARTLRWYWRDHEFPRYSAAARLAIELHNRRILAAALRDFNPDAVIHWSFGGMSLSLLEQVRRSGRPAVAVLLDDWLVYAPRVDGWQRGWRRFGRLAALAPGIGPARRVDLAGIARLVFMSAALREHAVAAGLEVAGSPVRYRGVDPGLFEARPPRPNWGGRLICVGRVEARKGVEIAIAALGLLPETTSLQILGPAQPAYRAELDRLIASRRLGDRVEFSHCGRDRVGAAIAAADALLFPVQWEEPWGLVPLEAMASGTPVIAAATGGGREYLRDGDNALVYADKPSDRADPARLAAAVRRLADGPALRSALHAGGLATVARFDVADFNAAILTEVEVEVAITIAAQS